MAVASARHILVETEEQCNDLKAQIESGEDFGKLAAEHSNCPSGQRGGELGTFEQGQMVPEFDKVVFSADLNQVQGPVQTDFGYHLIEVTHRGDSMPKASARHILVDSEEKALELKAQIEAGADFAELAKANSGCPSGAEGGELGTFGQGQMVPEFDEVVFSADLNTVVGPIQTDFGYHLIEVTARS